MEAKDRTDASLARRAVQSRAGRMAIKTAGWLVAIPALCALVVIGGAAPIYLLLPEASPVARDAPPPETMQTASILPSPEATATDDPPADAPPQEIGDAASPATVAPPPEEMDEALPPEETAESLAPVELPPEETAESLPPVETAESPPPAEATDNAAPEAKDAGEAQALAVTVVPTARPPRQTREPGASAEVRETADPSSASRKTPAAAPRPPEGRQASRSVKRFVTIRPVPLRSGPGGREVAMLGRGAEVLGGPCDDWCEVSSGGVTGWIHPSFLSASAPRAPSQRSVARTADPYDDEMRLDDRRRDRRRRDDAPGWWLDDEQPIEIYDGRR
ncbi:SH3 domain-containing protein [Aureimonas glaciei]|nr:SH3 domain-containing protein [Aureimonas glaciei]